MCSAFVKYSDGYFLPNLNMLCNIGSRPSTDLFMLSYYQVVFYR